jgi:hypothetical protein
MGFDCYIQKKVGGLLDINYTQTFVQRPPLGTKKVTVIQKLVQFLN